MKKILILALFISLVRMLLPLPVIAQTNGDLNGDGKVDIFDYNILVSSFGNPYTIFDYNILVTNFGTIQPTPTPTTTPTLSVTRHVMVIDFNPIIESMGNRRIRDIVYGQNPETLEADYINEIRQLSNGYVNYQVVSRLSDVDSYPAKDNGYVYTDETYLASLSNPDANAQRFIDYPKLINDYTICDKVNRGEIDEVWLWDPGGFGFYEAIMAGTGAYFTNGPPITGTSCTKKLHIMGFNYTRSTNEMLESYIHRIEGTLSTVYGEDPRFRPGTYTTPWGKFATSDIISPGHAGCGWIHYAPNSTQDYDWANQRFVTSTCDDWLHYPNLTGATQSINCSAWGCNQKSFEEWWLTHLPHVTGQTGGKWNNWWRYVSDSN